MPILKTEAIVLGKRDFRETSLLVNFFTRDFGKISGLLKGIRKEPQKFASTLEIFSLNDIVFYQSRNSSLHLVSQCDVKNNFSAARQSIFKVGSASTAMELADALTQPEDKNEEIFDLTLTCLQELETTNNPDKIMTIFKIKVLALSGFKPNFDCCVSCGSKILGQCKFSLNLGGLLCDKCQKKDITARSIFRGTTASILHIQRNDFKNNLNLGMNPEIKKELGSILDAFLNFHLERQLKSEKVMDKLEAVL
ncbi:MAG: DNA repair protein RecO [Candidatus Omnitrophica bacterium]|jgi:DNA repair protein RecO (recombination protein O)|nr:DNA repair protein RecO [Candidatus Omnitrophota bacterium]